MFKLKLLIKNLLYFSGALPLYHRFRNNNSLTVVLFHRVIDINDPRWKQSDPEWTVSDSFFSQCVAFFKQHYSIITIQDIDEFYTNRKPLPVNPLLITFDDGWADNFEYAVEICNQNKCKFHTFITTGVTGLAYLNWRETLHSLAKADLYKTSELINKINQKFNLSMNPTFTVDELIKDIKKLDEGLKKKITEHINSLSSLFTPKQQMLSSEQLNTMQQQGYYLGTHGHTHEPITECQDKNTELVSSKNILATVVKEPTNIINSMAFPHSAVNNEVYLNTVNAGYKYIFGGRKQLNQLSLNDDRPIYFGRINIDQTSLESNNHKLKGGQHNGKGHRKNEGNF